jgi:hypothetical protein
MGNKSPVQIESQPGINALDTSQFRIIMLMSYIIPTWQVAQQLLDYSDGLKRRGLKGKAIDLMVGNSGVPHFYQYPAVYVEEGSPSQIKEKNKKSNQFYKWVLIN